MFSVRLIKADHYMSIPIPGLDARYSEFRGIEVKQVPVIRIFGSTSSGQKVCLHIHGVFPYIYIPYDGSIEKERFIYQIASGIDKALNVSLGNSNSHTQHVFKITIVSAIPFYGFHSKPHQFLKIYFYNPLMIKKASDLLQNGIVLGQVFQPHEAHIPFILQFCMDYNLHGMSFVNLASVRYRQGAIEGSNFKALPLVDVPQELLLPENILRVSTCKLEVDAVAADILNRKDIAGHITSYPGLKAIWDEEKERRRNENRNSQFTTQSSQTREASSTASEKFHLERLKKHVCEIALLNENITPVMEKSLSGEKLKPYPAPTPEGVNHLEASFLVTHVNSLCHNNDLNKSDENGSKNLYVDYEKVEKSVSSSLLNSQIDSDPNSNQSNILNSQCRSLVEILQDLVEDDSLLGSQNQGNDEDNEKASDSDSDDDVLSQILDWKELGDSSCSPLRISAERKDMEAGSSSRREENFNLPQLDGANDLICEDDDEDLQPKHQVVSEKKMQQEQLLRIVPDCVSGTSDLPEIVTDYTRDNISLHFDLPVICEPVDPLQSKLNIGCYSDLGVVNELDIGTSLPLELSDNSDCLTNETSDNYLLSLDQCDGQKSLFFSESTDSDGLDETDKGINSKSLLLGDPWLISRPITSVKDEFPDENFSCSKDVWPIDTESSSWIPASEKYFSETPLINLPEDEISSQYESRDLTELSVEKNSGESRISSSETKRRLCSLIKSRTKAKEVLSINKINCELINVDDIVNCEAATVNEYENPTPFGAIFQGSDYDQFLEESYHVSSQNILSNVGDCNLLNDSDLKTLDSCAILECSKINFIDETFSKLQESLGEETFDISSSNALKPKKKPIFSHLNRIDDGTTSKQRLLDTRDQEGLKDHLARDIPNSCVSKPRRPGRKSVKEKDFLTSNKTTVLEEDKIENNYHLRNRVQILDRKRRKKPKEVNKNVSAHNVNESAIDVLQDSVNINNRTVKERLGILVRNSIGKKCPLQESLLEEKNNCDCNLFTGPKTRQSLKSSRAVRSFSRYQESILLPGSNCTCTSKKDVHFTTKDSRVSKSCKSMSAEKKNKDIGIKAQSVTENSLMPSEFEEKSVCVGSNKICANSNNVKVDEGLAKRRIGQYVRQRLGMLVESRSKLSPKCTDNASVLDSKVPSLLGKIDNGCSKVNSNKYLTRYRKKKINVQKLVENEVSNVEIANIVCDDRSVQNSCDNPSETLVRPSGIFLHGKNNNSVHDEKDTDISEKNSDVIDAVGSFLVDQIEQNIEVNGLPADKTKGIVATSVVHNSANSFLWNQESDLIEENLKINILQVNEARGIVDTSVKDAVSSEENSEKNELQRVHTLDLPFVKDAVLVEENPKKNEFQKEHCDPQFVKGTVQMEENSEENKSQEDSRSTIDALSVKDSDLVGVTSRENKLALDNRSECDILSENNTVLMEEDSEENAFQVIDSSKICYLSVKETKSIEKNCDKNALQGGHKSPIGTSSMKEISEEKDFERDIVSTVGFPSVKDANVIENFEEKALQGDNINAVDSPVNVSSPNEENSDTLQGGNRSAIDTPFVKDVDLIQEKSEESKLKGDNSLLSNIVDSVSEKNAVSLKNAKKNELQENNRSSIDLFSVKYTITPEKNSEMHKLQFDNSSAIDSTCLKDSLTLGENIEKSVRQKLHVSNKSIFKKQEDKIKNFRLANEVLSGFTEDLLNFHSIRPCYVRLHKCNVDECKGVKTVKSCKKLVGSFKKKRRKNLISMEKCRTDSSNEDSELTIELNSESINSGDKFPKTKKFEEEIDSNNASGVLLVNTAPGFVNFINEESNRFECVDLNMKCVVPNSPILLDKTLKKSGEIGSLKAVVQAESPRVADTLDTLPENPAQTVRHYAPGGIYLHSAESRSLHLVGDYLSESNVVEVAKIPQLDSTQSENSEQVSLREVDSEQKSECKSSEIFMETSEPVNKSKNLKIAEDTNEEFLSFTRKSLKRRILRSDGRYRRKRDKISENNASKVTCSVVANVNVTALNDQDKNIKKTANEHLIEQDKLCSSYQAKYVKIKNKFQNETQEEVILGSFSENNSPSEVNIEGSITCANSSLPSAASYDRGISDVKLGLNHPEMQSEQILSDQIKGLNNSSENLVNGKTDLSRRNTRLNSKNSNLKKHSAKPSKFISLNKKWVPKHNNDVRKKLGENPKVHRLEEDVPIKVQLRSSFSFNGNLDNGNKNSEKTVFEDKILGENKLNLKDVVNVKCKNGESLQTEIHGENCSGKQNNVVIPSSISSDAQRNTRLISKISKVKKRSAKPSKPVFLNKKWVPKHNNDVGKNFGENPKVDKIEEDDSIKLQLGSSSFFKSNLDDGNKDSGKTVYEDKVLGENKCNLKNIDNVKCKNGESLQIEIHGENYSGKQNNAVIPSSEGSISSDTPRNTRLNSKKSKVKIHSAKPNLSSLNTKLMPKHNNDMNKDFGENPKVDKIEEAVSIKVQLRSSSSFKGNLDSGNKDSGKTKTVHEGKVLSEKKPNLKDIGNVRCKNEENSQVEPHGESYIGIQNNIMILSSGDNIASETKKQKRSLPCVDGCNDSSDTDTANDLIPLSAQSQKPRKRVYKQVTTIGNKPAEELACPETFNNNVTHREKTENNLEKKSPVKSPKKQMYKPLDVVIKKSPLKNKSNEELQLVDPSFDFDVHSAQNKSKKSDCLRKYLSSVLKRFVKKSDIKKFQPRVMVKRLKLHIPKRQTVNLRTSRPRRSKLKHEIYCVNNRQGESVISGEKTKGVSLDLQQTEQSKKNVLCKHHREELTKVTCQ